MRFKISGTDSYGDRHTFETDDHARASSMLTQFQEDFEKVEYDSGHAEREE